MGEKNMRGVCGALAVLAATVAISAANDVWEWPEDKRAETSSGGYGPDPPGVPADFMCAWRQLAYNYSIALRPDAATKVYDALALGAYCNGTTRPNEKELPAWFPPCSSVKDNAIFVDASKGSDSNPGTMDSPLKTIQAGVDTAVNNHIAQVVLRGGSFFLKESVVMTSAHSGITLSNYKDEEVWVYGGTLLDNLEWKEYQITGGLNIWQTDLSSFGLAGVEGLRVNGERSYPARYPNANPETQFFPVGYLSSSRSDWLPPKIAPKPNPAQVVNVTAPNRDWDAYFGFYGGGIGGTCSIYDPPFSFWCQDTFSSGCGGCFTWNIPSGLKGTELKKKYNYWKEGKVMAWRAAHWANWEFELEDYDAESSTFKFGLGGFQGARGGPGSDWFLYNFFEELDVPGEYYYNTTSQQLYYFSNTTAGTPPTADTQFVAVHTKTLLNATGEGQSSPLKDLTITGIGFRDSAMTMLSPHAVPSGGDWSLERMGALFFEDTENLVVDNIKVWRAGGNALMLSKYNLKATVSNSEFAWLGGSAIAAWGWTDETSDGGIHGIDGTTGNFPRYTLISNNLFHEIGVWAKQSSAFFQAKAAQSTLVNNVVFNLARAGFNFNDGFGGGDNVTHNVLFHTCRESSDHGPINSWDRQPFLTTVRNGTPSTQMEWRELSENIVIANYGGSKEIDNDDGSLFYKNHNNFMAYGWVQKFKCGGIYSYNNIKAYVDTGGKFDAGCALTSAGFFPNLWHNDTMVHLGSGDFMYRECWGTDQAGHDFDKTNVYNNTIYMSGGKVQLSGGACKKPIDLADFQKDGNDPGTVVNDSLPPVPQLMEWVIALLGKWN